MTPKDIGKTVRAIRTDKGLVTTKLATMVGISQAQISRLENGQQFGGRCGFPYAAKALKVPPFRLFMTDKEWAKWSGKK